MKYWIFQGNPDDFDIDAYIDISTYIVWEVRQVHFASQMKEGDEVFMWRASGKSRKTAGIVARGVLLSSPSLMDDDLASKGFWKRDAENGRKLRVRVRLIDKCIGTKRVVKREWFKDDPILSEMSILKQPAGTNFAISGKEARRLADLVRNTGRAWTRDEDVAALWAYTQTLYGSVSRRKGSPVAVVALDIGRAVTGVYNKVMNFRAIDPRDLRKGLSAGSLMDSQVWDEFYDAEEKAIRISALNQEYAEESKIITTVIQKQITYKEFGDAPNDNPEELQLFAAKVRKGQPAFRRNLLLAYGSVCAISGYGPEEVLEAVHIIPHAKSGINKLDNGLLLRSDFHSLFDADLLQIDPEGFIILVDVTLRAGPYGQYHGQQLRTRIDGSQMGVRYLVIKWEELIKTRSHITE